MLSRVGTNALLLVDVHWQFLALHKREHKKGLRHVRKEEEKKGDEIRARQCSNKDTSLCSHDLSHQQSAIVTNKNFQASVISVIITLETLRLYRTLYQRSGKLRMIS